MVHVIRADNGLASLRLCVAMHVYGLHYTFLDSPMHDVQLELS